MKLFYIFMGFLVNYIDCSNVDGYAPNSYGLTPVYDAYILNDLVDIFNDFDNNMNSQFDMAPIDSESDESIADLLFEYQHYLDKAHNQHLNYLEHNQHLNYLEKSKSKNKVPLLRHDKYSKKRPGGEKTYNEIKNFYSSNFKYMPNSIDSFESFTSLNNGEKKLYNPESVQIKELFDNMESNTVFKNLYLPMSPKNKYGEIVSSCYCKDNKIPCKCGCKQCLFVMGSMAGKSQVVTLDNQNLVDNKLPEPQKYSAEDKPSDNSDDKFNIRIKVDIHFPKMFDPQRSIKNVTRNLGIEEVTSKESVSSINVPFPYIPQMNYPIPIDIYSIKKPFLLPKDPTHKITIHKKKKSRLSNSGKRHKTKKLLTFKFDSILPKNTFIENFTVENISKEGFFLNKTGEFDKHNMSNATSSFVVPLLGTNSSLGLAETEAPSNSKYNRSIDTIYLTLNISNNNVTKADDFSKIENSIETEINTKDIYTTLVPIKIRSKREILIANKNDSTLKVIGLVDKPNNTTKYKLNKVLADEDELLHWPDVSNNVTAKNSKNITTLILEREKKKSKLNITYDLIHKNHTNALEQAIFGDVNWDDVETVVPVFISFVGKYIRGVLSFCSQTMCHSMKCIQKICLHRICDADQRFNHKGHCVGNNGTDSIAALESIMDLPSNIALEIVDILQDKMLGKMFGKATLCITSKCVTFVASKKTFIKSKCTNKELSSTGHCPNINDSKVV